MGRAFGLEIPVTLEELCRPQRLALPRPRPSEAIFDKLAMSIFIGTPLELALRDRGINAFALASTTR